MTDDSRPMPSWPLWTERVRDVLDAAENEHVAQAEERARDDHSTSFGVASQHCESPIEALFLAAFLRHCLNDPSIRIFPQVDLGKYRVDFLVAYKLSDEFLRHVVVECDGHDYHDRTKAQAARDKKRDREISALGIPVFRFTGSELHKDPFACAEEIMDYLQGPILDEYNKSRTGRDA